MEVPQSALILAVDALPRDGWVFQQDDVAIHSLHNTREFLEASDVGTSDWSAKSPELKIIESMWGQLVHVVLDNGRQYNNVCFCKIQLWPLGIVSIYEIFKTYIAPFLLV